MSSGCFRFNISSQSRWSVAVISTVLGCGILIYGSCIYLKKNMEHAINSEEKSIMTPERFTQEQCRKVCTSKECVQASNFLLQSMNQSADPCEDFYSFSCGNWVKKFGENDNFSVIESMGITLKIVLKDVLENSKGSPGSSFEKTKMVYNSCKNEHSSERNAVPTATDILSLFGIRGWPNLPDDFQFTHSLEKTLGIMSSYNQFSFLLFSMADSETDDSSSANGLPNLTISLNHDYFCDPSENSTYGNLVLKLLHHFGVNKQNAKQMWEEFLAIDAAIYKIYLDSRNDGYDADTTESIDCSITATTDTVTKVAICEILKTFVESMGGNQFSKDNVYISGIFNSQDVFSVLGYFSPRLLANYLALRFVNNHLEFLSTDFRIARAMYVKPVYEWHDTQPFYISKWRHCVSWVSHFMTYSLAQHYVRNVLSPGNRKEMIDIIGIYIQEGANYAGKQKWITKALREKLKYSTSNVTNNLNEIINLLLNGTAMDSFLDEFRPTNESFLQNAVAYRKHVYKFYLLNSETIETYGFLSNLFVVNAYHSSGTIDIRFGMFSPPLYKYGLPKLINLVTMGTTIGHEIGHEITSFLEEEENFDSKTIGFYNEKRKCLEEQYFEYEIKKLGKRVKGNQTLHENLADLIGIEITQQIINKFIEKKSGTSDLKLPALNFSSRQLLYISLAQMWCAARSKKREHIIYEEDIHAPSDIRITGMLRNLQEFSDAFSCAPGSYMNPVHKCSFSDRN